MPTLVVLASVPGLPIPQGSVIARMSRAGKPFVKHDSRNLAAYRADIREEVGRKMPWVGPVADRPFIVRVEFHMPRPKGHYGAKGLRATAPRWPTKRPDVDKLARAVLDALTGLVWADDSQVVRLMATKVWATFADGQSPSTSIIIEEE